jgi:hypothetical protein
MEMTTGKSVWRLCNLEVQVFSQKKPVLTKKRALAESISYRRADQP